MLRLLWLQNMEQCGVAADTATMNAVCNVICLICYMIVGVIANAVDLHSSSAATVLCSSW